MVDMSSCIRSRHDDGRQTVTKKGNYTKPLIASEYHFLSLLLSFSMMKTRRKLRWASWRHNFPQDMGYRTWHSHESRQA